jgi:hypothetical protein
MHHFMNEKELILFCDESISKGHFYSNFYGGVLVPATRYQKITQRLLALRDSLGISDEIKWVKCTAQRLSAYAQIIDTFFDEVIQGHLKVRIMFRQNARKPRNLTEEHADKEYFLLYYQFIKHAFDFHRHTSEHKKVRLRLYFDQFPDTRAVRDEFKQYLLRLDSRHFIASPISISPEDITEVVSHNHIILQCLDVVLGAMAFRLNNLHKEKPPGSRRRGKRTIAKEALYTHILSRIREIKPRFNIGMSTRGTEQYPDYRDLPYAHWAFTPKDFDFDHSLTKKGERQKNSPTEPT